jgi:hypothetical protein
MLYPKWEGTLRQARQETNQHRLLKLVREVELAIFQRVQELPANADGDDERQAILAACGELLRIKTDRLGWPTWMGERREVREDSAPERSAN